MQFSKVKPFVFFLSCILTSPFVVAAGGGDGSSGKEASAEKSDAELAAIRYAKKQSEVSSLESRVREGRAAVKALIQSQRAAASREQAVQIVEQIKERHQQLKTEIEKYNAARAELIYNFPGKADATERKYMPIRTQSVQQLEEELGLDADLNQLKAEVEQKYKSTAPVEEVQVPTQRQPAAEKPPIGEKPKRLRLER